MNPLDKDDDAPQAPVRPSIEVELDGGDSDNDTPPGSQRGSKEVRPSSRGSMGTSSGTTRGSLNLPGATGARSRSTSKGLGAGKGKKKSSSKRSSFRMSSLGLGGRSGRRSRSTSMDLGSEENGGGLEHSEYGSSALSSGGPPLTWVTCGPKTLVGLNCDLAEIKEVVELEDRKSGKLALGGPSFDCAVVVKNPSGGVFAAGGGGLVAVNGSTGAIVWKASLGGKGPFGLDCDGAKGVFASYAPGGKLSVAAFDARSGAQKWLVEFADTEPSMSHGVTLDGHSNKDLVFACGFKWIVAYKKKDGTEAWRVHRGVNGPADDVAVMAYVARPASLDPSEPHLLLAVLTQQSLTHYNALTGAELQSLSTSEFWSRKMTAPGSLDLDPARGLMYILVNHTIHARPVNAPLPNSPWAWKSEVLKQETRLEGLMGRTDLERVGALYLASGVRNPLSALATIKYKRTGYARFWSGAVESREFVIWKNKLLNFVPGEHVPRHTCLLAPDDISMDLNTGTHVIVTDSGGVMGGAKQDMDMKTPTGAANWARILREAGRNQLTKLGDADEPIDVLLACVDNTVFGIDPYSGRTSWKTVLPGKASVLTGLTFDSTSGLAWVAGNNHYYGLSPTCGRVLETIKMPHQGSGSGALGAGRHFGVFARSARHSVGAQPLIPAVHHGRVNYGRANPANL